MAKTMSSPVQMNKSAVFTMMGGACFLLYLIYSILFASRGTSASSGKLTIYDTWKTRDFVDIPNEIEEKQKLIQIAEHYITFDVDGESYTVYFKEHIPKTSNTLIPVLLLHGAGDSSDVWMKTKTLTLLGAMGYRAVAVDLPGWGNTKGRITGSDKSAKFLKRFMEEERIDRPILIVPSMAGAYAIPYLMNGRSYTCQDRARGFIPLAPVHTSLYKDSEYHKCEVPTMIVYGSKDTHLGLNSLNDLRNMKNAEIFAQKNQGHASYIDNSEEWRRLLYNYLLAVERWQD